MASSYSFDIVSDVDMQEVDNAINQSRKEISQRYDFKNSTIEIELVKDEIKITADDDFKMKAVIEVLKGKFVKRGISPKALEFEEKKGETLGAEKRTAKIIKGISKEKSKLINTDIKNSGLKVKTLILDDVLRVTAKDKDELQKVIALVKGNDYDISVQFTNYR